MKGKPRIIYLPLEPYEERYTCQLTDWTVRRFEEHGFDLTVIAGDLLDPVDTSIKTGVALDSHGRSYYALTQHAKLVKLISERKLTPNDIIYNQDMFAPGYSALPYIFYQEPIGNRPHIVTHCLAQSIDPNDFTFPMRRWMRHAEMIVDKTVDAILVACDAQIDMLRTAMFEARVVNVGLLFDRDEVRARVPSRKPLHRRLKRIVFASRWDREKQPHFFMDLVLAAQEDELLRQYTFCICTGAKHLRSNDHTAIERALELEKLGLLTIFSGLTKTDYYRILADSRLHFNCAKQDFISNTLNEASALGTPSLLPAYLSFPEAVNNNADQLYVPWSLPDALNKMRAILNNPPEPEVVAYSADKQHATLDKVIDFFESL